MNRFNALHPLGLSAVALVASSFAAPVYGMPITGLYDSGSVGWFVNGGACPTNANNCTPGTPYSNSPVEVAYDATLIEPIPGFGFWNTTSNGASDSSRWVAPSVRGSSNWQGAAGTVNYPDNSPVGLDMDFGVFTGASSYVFYTSFTLDPSQVIVGTAGITGAWWADGMLRPLCSIQLNGTCIDQTAPFPGAYTLGGGNAFSFNSGFLPGLNTLAFYVENRYRETGVRVDLEGSVQAVPPENPNEPEIPIQIDVPTDPREVQTPEPGMGLLIGAGLVGLVALRKRLARQ